MSLRGAAVVHVQVRSDEEISLLGSACCVCRGWVGGWVLHRHKPPSLRHPFPIIEVRTRRLTHKGRRRFLFLPGSIPVPSRYHMNTCGSGGLGGLGGLGCGHDVCINRLARRKRTGTSTSWRWSPPTAICTSRAGTTRSRANGRGAYRRQVSGERNGYQATSDIRIPWYSSTQ